MARYMRTAAPGHHQNMFVEDSENAVPTGAFQAPSTNKQPKQPLGMASSNVVFNPPSAYPSKHSPAKSGSRASALSPLKASHGNRINGVPMLPPTAKQRATDSLQKKQPFLTKFKTVAQKPVMDLGSGKENMHPTIFPAPTTFNFTHMTPVAVFAQSGLGKRTLLEAPNIMDGRASKKARTVDDTQYASQNASLPPHDSFPPIKDDGSKPGHSYATLIGMAILRSPNRRLTLSQIYKWISETYSFYSLKDTGWQNSIRHNLSLHKQFIKLERPKDDPGKGHYWAIEEGCEGTFLSQKPTRKSTSAAEIVRLEPARPAPELLSEPILPLQTLGNAPLPPLPAMREPMTVAPEISSDATIPMPSDAAGPDDLAGRTVERRGLETDDAIFDPQQYSPLPAAMHSSPPIPRQGGNANGTPPAPRRVPVSSASRPRKRKVTSMDDSGYISSLESSVMRPSRANYAAPDGLPKSGRAEDHIAKMRSSSFDSPTKGRPWIGSALPSSSPLRPVSNQRLPPETPAARLKVPHKPPTSISPNTNLRIHRDNVQKLLQSPLRNVVEAGEEVVTWSPAFHLPDSDALLDLQSTFPGFDIFEDIQGLPDLSESIFVDSMVPIVTPDGRSVKRPRLDRSQSVTNMGEMNGSAINRTARSNSFLRVADHMLGSLYDTPSRAFDMLASSPSRMIGMASPSKQLQLGDLDVGGDWCNLPADMLTTDPTRDLGGSSPVDCLKGFAKIGAADTGNGASGPGDSGFGGNFDQLL